MGLIGTKIDDCKYNIEVPFYRTDIMHQCDIAEDLAIGYGFNNIPFIEPRVNC